VIGTLTNANYTVASTNTGSWTVNPAPVTVTALGGSSTYGSSPANPGLSATGLQNGQNVSALTGLSNSFGIIGTSNAGSYVLSVIGTLTNTNYTVAGTNTGNWTVNPAPVTVTALGGSSVFGSSPANPGLSATGLQNGQGVNVLTGLYNPFGITSTSKIGSYILSVGGVLTNGNYVLAGTVPGTWTVTNTASVTGGTNPSNGTFPPNPSVLASAPSSSAGMSVLAGLAGATDKVNAGSAGGRAAAASADPSRAALDSRPPAPPAGRPQPDLSVTTPPAAVNVAPARSASNGPARQGDCGGNATGGGSGDGGAGCASQAAPRKAVGLIDFALGQLNRGALLEAVGREFVDVVQAKAVPRQVLMVSLASASFALTAGLVGWFLRGGALISALLSSMPLWRGFDPLVVVMRPRRGGEPGWITSKVDAMFDGAHAVGYGPGRSRP